MLKSLTFLPSLALLVVLALPASAQPDADTVVASVNGKEITVGHMIVARAALPQQYQQLEPEVLYNALLDQLIQQTALELSLDGKTPRRVSLQIENEMRSLMAAEVIEEVMGGAGGDEAVKAAYDAKYVGGSGVDEFSAAHILVETEEEANAIKADLDKGADFAKTAMLKSTGPSGPGGGDLGWFGLGAMVPEFEAAIITLEPGQVSDPVKTQFGWHVILLNEKRQSAAPELESVRQELKDGLRQSAVEARIEELTAAATIERPEVEGLTPDMIQNLDLLEN